MLSIQGRDPIRIYYILGGKGNSLLYLLYFILLKNLKEKGCCKQKVDSNVQNYDDQHRPNLVIEVVNEEYVFFASDPFLQGK